MKRIISIMLVLALVLSLAACGGSGDNSGTNVGSGDSGTNVGSGDGGSNVGSGDGGKVEFVAKEIEGNPTTLGVFYRNVTGADIESKSAESKEVDKKADEMLKKIEEMPDNIQVSGKTYYLSAEGADSNDGLSPEKPKLSYMALKGQLQEGDAVLFRRGDIFRGQMVLVSGVTYGAYGKGIKPRIYGSVDGKEGEWQETTTPGVYTYNKVVKYANIIFNNGEAIGRPVQSMSQITKKPLNVYFSGSRVSVYSPEGNPKEIYDSIEIVGDYNNIKGGQGGTKNVKIQNLCIVYAGVHNIGSLGITNGFEVEGCIVGYCGGKDLWQGSRAVSLGNSIEFWSQAVDVNIHDNYFFQAFDAALTHQGPTSTTNGNNAQTCKADFTNIHYENNLIEYCTYDIEAFTTRTLADQSKSPNGTFTYNDVYVKGNICRFTGWGWGSLDRPDKNVYAVFKYDASGEQDANGNYTNRHVKPLYIENNIFDRARRVIFNISSPETNKANIIIKNNQIYARSNTRIIGDLTIKDDYMSKLNQKYTMEGNTFTLVQ